MDIEELKDTISIQEAATHLHRSKKTVYRWVESGKLPAAKVGGQYFIKISAVEALASGQVAYSDTIVQKIDTIETHLQALEYRFGNLERRLDSMEAQKTPTIIPEPLVPISPLALPRYEKPVRTQPQSSGGTLPEETALRREVDGGMISYTDFYRLHHIKSGPSDRAREKGHFQVTAGAWHDEATNHTITLALDRENQEAFCRHFKYRARTRLTECSFDDCPCHVV